MRIKSIILWSVLFVGLFPTLVCAADSEIVPLVSTDTTVINTTRERASNGLAYEKRKGKIVFSVKGYLSVVQRQKAIFESSTREQSSQNKNQISIDLFDDASFIFNVLESKQINSSISSFSGRSDLGSKVTISATIGEETYLLSVRDYDNDKLYKVVGDISTGLGVVTEVDLSAIPPIIDSPPRGHDD